MKLIYGLLIIAAVLLVALFTSGCEVFKHRSSNQSDTTHVHKEVSDKQTDSNSGSVSKEENTSKTETDWYRIIAGFQHGEDTTINNIITTPGASHPAYIVLEGGKTSNESHEQKYDSSYANALLREFKAYTDSLSAANKSEDIEKHSETKGVGVLFVVFISLIVVMISRFIGGQLSKFQVVKKAAKVN